MSTIPFAAANKRRAAERPDADYDVNLIVNQLNWKSTDRAVAGFESGIDVLFNCAGLPQTFPAVDVVRVNFLGIRHWTEAWLPKLKDGGAIVSISSTAGMGYLQRQSLLRELMAIADEEAAIGWLEGHADHMGDGYGFFQGGTLVGEIDMGKLITEAERCCPEWRVSKPRRPRRTYRRNLHCLRHFYNDSGPR